MCDIESPEVICIESNTLTEEELRIERRKASRRAAAKRFYEKNKEKVIKQNAEYIKKNREPHNKRSREYQRRKSEQLRELKAKLDTIENLLNNKLIVSNP